MNKLIMNLQKIKVAIFDLDGVIYRGETLIPGVDNIIQYLKEMSIKVVYNSNNSTATRKTYVERLNKLNIKCAFDDFYTSASITAFEIKKIKPNSNIYIIGEEGLKEELVAQGLHVLDKESNYNDIDFVVVGLDRNLSYNKLAFAQKCILEGKAEFFATNEDATLPVKNGLLPGAGVMVNALKTCTNKKPKMIFGKPNPHGIELILEDLKVKREEAVIFGDRLNTDIVAGNRAGIITILILTGVTTKNQVEMLKENPNVDQDLIPSLVIESLEEIFIK